MSDKDLKSLRQVREEIDKLDSQLLATLAQRRQLAEQVIEAKDASLAEVRDEARERALLMKRISEGRELGLSPMHVTKIYHEIIAESIRHQQDYLQRKLNGKSPQSSQTTVAFHGIDGSYGHLAGQSFFKESGRRTPGRYIACSSYEGVVKAVESGACDYGILPIENTTTGAINEVYDLLLQSRVSIVGEEKHSVRYCVVGYEGIPVAHLQRIHCSPQAVAECSHFLATVPLCQVEYSQDSASAVKRVKELAEPPHAAIASEEAAELFGLHVVQRGIGNQEDSYTRYLVIAKQPSKVDPRVPSKTSIIIHTANRAGALVDALSIFKSHQINLTKLESRPVPANAWDEMFYLDFHGNLDSVEISAALAELTRTVRFIKVLGCYPACDIEAVDVAHEPLAAAGQQPIPPVACEVSTKQSATSASSKSSAYKLASREHKPTNTVITVGNVAIGDGNFLVIAGPCSVESREQIMACAQHAHSHGAKILRGGVFKPRTSPYSFQGLGYEGLDLLVEAGRAHGMPIITEVMTTEDVSRVAEKADIIQIGARNMQNYSLLKALGEIRRPVMLKRGMSAPIEEVLQAVEYILAGGNQQVFLCERGIRTFETATRGTLDISAVPVLKAKTHLPVFIDPSHAAGVRDLVPPLALAAKAVGADGIIVEFHPDPEQALSDGPQALRFHQFEKLMSDLQKLQVG
jgi:chorismate mutase/prephenate dehydratase